jgi:hypothetical protein
MFFVRPEKGVVRKMEKRLILWEDQHGTVFGKLETDGSLKAVSNDVRIKEYGIKFDLQAIRDEPRIFCRAPLRGNFVSDRVGPGKDFYGLLLLRCIQIAVLVVAEAAWQCTFKSETDCRWVVRKIVI